MSFYELRRRLIWAVEVLMRARQADEHCLAAELGWIEVHLREVLKGRDVTARQCDQLLDWVGLEVGRLPGNTGTIREWQAARLVLMPGAAGSAPGPDA